MDGPSEAEGLAICATMSMCTWSRVKQFCVSLQSLASILKFFLCYSSETSKQNRMSERIEFWKFGFFVFRCRKEHILSNSYFSCFFVVLLFSPLLMLHRLLVLCIFIILPIYKKKKYFFSLFCFCFLFSFSLFCWVYFKFFFFLSVKKEKKRIQINV